MYRICKSVLQFIRYLLDIMQPAGVLSAKQQAIYAELIYCMPFAAYSIKLLINCPFVDVLEGVT